MEIPLVIDNFTQVKHTILYWFQVNKIYEWVDILGKEYMKVEFFECVNIWLGGVFKFPATPQYPKLPEATPVLVPMGCDS